ncbi:glycosyltransferase [Actinomadura sp. KC06]|uniref:glycosyltransferase family 4 protein n=1 Tax=Actinomadura sp. KC06 TaxID=2530369 RepID=UPI00104F9E79|nr:glycosyltransferase family 4 protein [Actinomadura sp. KC06]TDD31221.1 glycosyltransferase [Actinomadura sp. KC06]
MTTVAYCLLTYRPDHPSGIERSIAAQMAGMRELGHEPLVIAAGPPRPGDADEPALIRLKSVVLPALTRHTEVVDAIADERAVAAEVRGVLADHGVDVACWGAPVWGLGHLGAAPPGTLSVLMVHNTLRPTSDPAPMHRAVAAADVVCPASPYVLDSYASAGWDTTDWRIVPNAVLSTGLRPPSRCEREQLRRRGPVRIVSRADPGKGQACFLEAMPAGWDRPIEIVLAEADFEFAHGQQARAVADCRAQADRRSDVVTLHPALRWHDVPAYFAEAAATVITSVEPETFSHTTAEALSVGTPVVAFDLGFVPDLAGPAGRVVPLEDGFAALWSRLHQLLHDCDAYHAASRAAPGRIAHHNPVTAASALLAAALPSRI